MLYVYYANKFNVLSESQYDYKKSSKYNKSAQKWN